MHFGVNPARESVNFSSTNRPAGSSEVHRRPRLAECHGLGKQHAVGSAGDPSGSEKETPGRVRVLKWRGRLKRLQVNLSGWNVWTFEWWKKKKLEFRVLTAAQLVAVRVLDCQDTHKSQVTQRSSV